ncbi:MAG: rod shape-determining protein RodA [Chloroflexota bacterium]|nr:MAG: rod shape-determining protein RodA [Chloroflexota bacterium]
MFDRKLWRNFDFLLLLIALLLTGYGLLLLYSTSLTSLSGSGNLIDLPFMRQSIFLSLGLLLLVCAAAVNYRSLTSIYIHLYVAIILLLISVIVIGDLTHGARRWLDLRFFQLQPSEPAKVILIVALAAFLANKKDRVTKWHTFVISGLFLVPLVGLTYMQPDLGTILVFVAIWLGMVVVAGVRLLYLGMLGTVVVAFLPIIYMFGLRGYMRERLVTFLDPTADRFGEGYNVLQSTISVGSGGLFGKGFGNGTQTQLQFLRVQHTDFIFSVLGEELGFVGAMVLFALYIFLLFRLIRAASRSSDPFGRLLATGMCIMILGQAFINVGVNIRLLPVTGIPLPFISAGGSSLMTLFVCLGIAQSVIMHQRKLVFS